MESNLLSLLVWLPVLGLLGIALIPRHRTKEIKWMAALATGIQLVLAIVLWSKFDPSDAGMQFVERADWIPSFNISYILGVDGLSLPMVILTALLCFIGVFVSWKIDHAVKGYFALFLLLDTGIMGVFVSMDFFLFYIFWEVMLLPMYFLIGIWGGPQREYAAIKFFLYTLFGSVLMLIGILGLYFTCGQTFDIQVLIQNAPEMLSGVMWWGMSAIKVIWVLLFIGFAIKVPVFPFHTWLPLAHVEAPTAISVLLAGILLKLGVYGILRLNYGLMPDGVWWFAGALAFLGLINVVWGGLCALAQTDLKKLVAYSSINHMGYSLIGMAAVIAAGSANGANTTAAQAGLAGAVFQMFNHGTISAMLFILVGVIYDRAHHREINGFGGLASQMPIYTGITALAFFAGLGLPGFSGFISEAMCFIGAFPVFKGIVIASTVGILLNAAYFLWAFQRIFFGKLNDKYSDLAEINSRELFTVIPLAIITVILGVYPAPFLNLVKSTLNLIIEMVASGSPIAGM
ncbi:MAG: NADH-quinone oxidoreductase subunit M [Candidatus Marinimicrobia bacterium]|jgi:NADH-quinone oxidoreductase subunit M|nr:NADH-quinone oxidoreductase subunit M [Candidatus Neomarinimicrobiota bacterium]MBT3961859.1 NADH-quinone oxidoreductase subunit M [Candidatus Neomarinimicrobiota bacterium]MBT4382687.1 NADH-quinone oxidoreductase subunit M [Candidatus Neomarinimicrobiota bacterium]MBT4636693.1 NADH-quinone oxidoreductase subunit M [Candidatus Neomarinimicrobiota bacterium]MBT4685378.1 NADH-quinone oxidoreductase subunit M [Candidatus Neomarinimicrobiota bacterium]